MSSVTHLLEVMARLRHPEQGCPWDREQDFDSIAPYTIEEAYEVADAIDRDDMGDLREELGDLLFQVVFHAQMAQEKGAFDFSDVAEGIVEKMVRRHPHVFDDESVADAAAQTAAWEKHKAQERALKGKQEDNSVLAGVALGLPGLMRAQKLQKRAARVGFDWPEPEGVMQKLNEELLELTGELDSGDKHHIADEVGDVLFTCVNLARHLGVDAEEAMRAANAKFERRFRQMESALKNEGRWDEADLAEKDKTWERIKSEE